MRASVIATVSAVVTGLIVAVASVAMLAVIGVSNFNAGQRSAAAAAPVLSAIETGAVTKTAAVQVHSVPISSLEIPSGRFGAGTVTASAPPEGAILNEGDFLVMVNETPVILMQGEIPAYRSLGVGMSGKDVEQLQAYLGRNGYAISDRSGSFGTSTAKALAAFFTKRGLPVVTSDGSNAASSREAGLPLSRYIFVASVPVIVEGQCGQAGQAADALKCVLTSQARKWLAADATGQPLSGRTVTLHSKSGSGMVAKIGSPVTGPEKQQVDGATAEPAAQDPSQSWYALADLPANTDDLAENATVVIAVSPADGLRVPATAIREAADGRTYIRVARDGQQTSSKGADRTVEMLLCASGYCAIRGDGLSAGMKVVLLE